MYGINWAFIEGHVNIKKIVLLAITVILNFSSFQAKAEKNEHINIFIYLAATDDDISTDQIRQITDLETDLAQFSNYKKM